VACGHLPPVAGAGFRTFPALRVVAEASSGRVPRPLWMAMLWTCPATVTAVRPLRKPLWELNAALCRMMPIFSRVLHMQTFIQRSA
jgi:hypothetical protein